MPTGDLKFACQVCGKITHYQNDVGVWVCEDHHKSWYEVWKCKQCGEKFYSYDYNLPPIKCNLCGGDVE